MIIACVYKTGGDFTGEYVDRLYKALKHTLLKPDIFFVCLTDADDVPEYISTIPLNHDWPNWWSKIELFSINDDILYFDLDTVFRGSIDDMIEVCLNYKGNNLVMLRDFYQPERPAAGVMFIPEGFGVIYDEFVESPEYFMNQSYGDQTYMLNCIHKHGLKYITWDKLLPMDYIASYKAHVIKNYPKKFCHNIQEIDLDKTKVVCYHGKPRPHQTNWDSG